MRVWGILPGSFTPSKGGLLFRAASRIGMALCAPRLDHRISVFYKIPRIKESFPRPTSLDSDLYQPPAHAVCTMFSGNLRAFPLVAIIMHAFGFPRCVGLRAPSGAVCMVFFFVVVSAEFNFPPFFLVSTSSALRQWIWKAKLSIFVICLAPTPRKNKEGFCMIS